MVNLKFISDVINENGECYLYGGAVRDEILGLKLADYDFVVRKMPLDRLFYICSLYGETLMHKYMPGSIRMHTDICGIVDICLPKKYENNEFTFNENYTIDEHLVGIDFTMNALIKDMKSDEIYDKYDGIKDIQNKMLVLNPSQNDLIFNPIIPIRAARFISAFNFDVDDRTMEIFKRDSKLMFEKIPEIRLKFEMYRLYKLQDFLKGVMLLEELGILERLMEISKRDWDDYL